MACFEKGAEGFEKEAEAGGTSLKRDVVPTASACLVHGEGSHKVVIEDGVDCPRGKSSSAFSIDHSGSFAVELCSGGVAALRSGADVPSLQETTMKASGWNTTFVTASSTGGSFNFYGALIPSFSSDSSSFGGCELPLPSAPRPIAVTDTADSRHAEKEAASEEGSWPDFELFASEAELRLGEQVSDLLVCPEFEDALEVRPPSELATSARAHISKVLFY